MYMGARNVLNNTFGDLNFFFLHSSRSLFNFFNYWLLYNCKHFREIAVLLEFLLKFSLSLSLCICVYTHLYVYMQIHVSFFKERDEFVFFSLSFTHNFELWVQVSVLNIFWLYLSLPLQFLSSFDFLMKSIR